jgi:hypothetical protein
MFSETSCIDNAFVVNVCDKYPLNPSGRDIRNLLIDLKKSVFIPSVVIPQEFRLPITIDLGFHNTLTIQASQFVEEINILSESNVSLTVQHQGSLIISSLSGRISNIITSSPELLKINHLNTAIDFRTPDQLITRIFKQCDNVTLHADVSVLFIEELPSLFLTIISGLKVLHVITMDYNTNIANTEFIVSDGEYYTKFKKQYDPMTMSLTKRGKAEKAKSFIVELVKDIEEEDIHKITSEYDKMFQARGQDCPSLVWSLSDFCDSILEEYNTDEKAFTNIDIDNKEISSDIEVLHQHSCTQTSLQDDIRESKRRKVTCNEIYREQEYPIASCTEKHKSSEEEKRKGKIFTSISVSDSTFNEPVNENRRHLRLKGREKQGKKRKLEESFFERKRRNTTAPTTSASKENTSISSQTNEQLEQNIEELTSMVLDFSL